MDPTQGRPKLSYTLTPITIPSPSGSKEEETRLYLRGTLSHAGPDSVENVSRSALRWLADWAGTEYTPSRRLSKGRPLKGSLERHTGSDGSSSWYIRRAGKTLYGAGFDTAVRARFASDLLESCPELAAVEFVDSSVFARHQAGLARRGIPIMTVWHLPTEADGGRAAIIDDDQDRDDAADAEGTDGMVSTPITSTKRPPARVWVGISSIGERKAPIQNRSLHVMTNLDTDDDLASLYNATERYLQESRLHTDDHKYKTSDRLLQDAAKIASILRHSLPEELQGRTDVKAMPFYKLRAKLRRLHTRSDANRLMLLGRTNEEAALLMSGNSSSSAVKGAIFDGLGFEPAGQMGSKGGVKMAVAHGKQLWPSVAEWRDSVVDTS